MRAIWKGTIGFGLVSIPVRMYNAVVETTPKLHLVHAECGTRIKLKRYCPGCERIIDWNALFKLAQAHNLEGVMAKEKSSPYLPGKRRRSWQKFKTKKEGIFVIAGLTYGEGARQDSFGALILGRRGENGKLCHVGNVGTGFSDYHLKEIMKLCQPLEISDSPFANFTGQEIVRFWCRPVLRCEVRYVEISGDGKLHFPAFRRLIKEGAT